jgi:formylglycine-generating enzyme required for sulfatase activity
VLKKLLRVALYCLAAVVLFLVAVSCWFKFVLLPTPDYSNLEEYHPFTSSESKNAYYEFYDSQERRWPVPFRTQTVKAADGETYVRLSGRGEATPLVLLPGGGQSSLMWIPNVAGLAEHYRVIAVDNIVDFGRSRLSRPIKSSEHLCSWLDESLTALGIEGKVNVMGLSYGGWVAAQFALRRPHRVNRAVVIAPAATIYPLGEDFLINSIRALVFPSTLKEWILSMSKDAAASTDPFVKENLEALIDGALLGFSSFKYKNILAPTVFSDAELGAIKPPTLFMVGENETLYPAEQAAARIKAVAPHLETRIIKDAGHDITLVQAQRVNEAAISFFRPSPAQDERVAGALPESFDGMVLIRGGTFVMGDTFGDGDEDERPVHTVTLDDFYLSRKEVTVAEYLLFCRQTERALPPEPPWGWIDDHPVVNVTWHDVVDYCKWLSENTGRDYYMPSEAEWEYAARNGGKRIRYPTGDSIGPDKANCDRFAEWEKDKSKPGTTPVGSFPPNELGIYDMAGNVHEWAGDCYQGDYYAKSGERNPTGPDCGKLRVDRGGSWSSPREFARSANRNYAEPGFGAFNLGFRLAVPISSL